MKKAGALFIAFLLALLLLVVTLSDSVKNNSSKPTKVATSTQSKTVKKNITKKKTTEVSKKTTEKQKSSTEETKKEKNTTEKAKDSDIKDVSMKEININSLNYTNELSSMDVRVSEKHVYLHENMIFYSVVLEQATDTKDTEKYTYYVSYSAYNSLLLGDLCTIEYECLNNGLISIFSLKKK